MKRAKVIMNIPSELREDVELFLEQVNSYLKDEEQVYNLIEIYSLWHEYTVRYHVLDEFEYLEDDSEVLKDFVRFLYK